MPIPVATTVKEEQQKVMTALFVMIRHSVNTVNFMKPSPLEILKNGTFQGVTASVWATC